MKENADRERGRGREFAIRGLGLRVKEEGEQRDKQRTVRAITSLGLLSVVCFCSFSRGNTHCGSGGDAAPPPSLHRHLDGWKKSLAVIRGRPSVRLSVPLSSVWSGSSKTPLPLGCYTWMDRIDRASGVELCLPRPAGQRPCVDRPGRHRRARGRQTGG